MPTLLKGLSENNILLNDIEYIFITHCHDDHVGLIKEIITQNTNLKLIISEKGGKFCQTGKHNNIPGSGHINKRVSFVLKIKSKLNPKWNHTFPSFNIREQDIIITKDCKLSEIGINLNGSIILTPGHTLDHMSLIIDDKCICGDAAANFLGFLGLKNCVISVNDINTYYTSWDKIINQKVTTIVPSHGDQFSVKRLVNNLRKNKEKNVVKWGEEYLTTAST